VIQPQISTTLRRSRRRAVRIAGRRAAALVTLGSLVSAVGVAGGGRDALAAGFEAARFGGEQGSVVTTNPTALYYNPAGIGFSDGTHVFLDGDVALRNLTWTHTLAPTDVPDPPNAQGANTGTAHAFNVFAGPALGATTRFGNFAVGAGLFVPFGGRESWDTNKQFVGSMYPLAADGVQRWHIINAALTFIYGTLGAAYRLGPLSVGVAGNFVAGSVSFSQAKNVSGMGQADTTNEDRVSLDASGNTGSFGVGAMLEVVPDRVWLAASYQSQPGMGPQSLGGTLDIQQHSSGSAVLGEYKPKVTLTQALPDIVRAGIRWRATPSLELRLFGEYTRWSVMHTQCVAVQGYACAVYPNGSDATSAGAVLANYVRDWKDTVNVRAGASYWITPRIETFAGTGFENAAVPDSTLEPSLADADNIELALGARARLLDWLYVALSYTHLQYLDRDNTGKSTIANALVPTFQQDGGGKYTQWVGFFDLNVEKTF
jgi:long-chain fatty acid transport protein